MNNYKDTNKYIQYRENANPKSTMSKSELFGTVVATTALVGCGVAIPFIIIGGLVAGLVAGKITEKYYDCKYNKNLGDNDYVKEEESPVTVMSREDYVEPDNIVDLAYDESLNVYISQENIGSRTKSTGSEL
ncbi:MAG TPA: hypothetical protein DEP72_04175 [Clostridiales bacterium]|nr:MAG: hypothetical protein A2Y18_08085 [Clostridiales bacterium GWD2_32_19]HCC07339.1 hypothetical protein [Clostridiales bacterium]